MTRLFKLLKTDAQLLAAIRQGDDSALGVLYNKNLRMIIKYFVTNSGTEEEAREYLQDALVIFWEKARDESFELTSKLTTFIFSIVKNRWMRELARRKKHTNLTSVEANPDGSLNAEEEYQEKETVSIVRECMKLLSPVCQKILTFYYYDRKSMAEISQLTGLANENVAKAKKYQCKKELENLIKKALI